MLRFLNVWPFCYTFSLTIMEQKVILLFAVICFQGTIAAPLPYVTRLNAPPRIQNPTENGVTSGPTPNNTELYQEFQRLKDSAAGFQNQIVNFTTALSSQLQPGSALWSLTDDVIKSATNKVISYIKSVETSGAEFLAKATRSVSGQMRQGKKILDDKLMHAQKTVEALQKKNEEMFRDSMSYLENLESNLKANLMRNARLPIESGNDSSDPKKFEDENQHLQRRSGSEQPAPNSFVLEQMNGIRDSGAGVLRGVTALSTGTIIGILDAISSIFSTTTQVSYHAKRALSSINRSGANAVNSVIGTAGAIVSGTLDKTGQVINAMRFAPQRPMNVEGGSASQRALTLSFPTPPRNLLPSDDDSDASEEAQAVSQPRASQTEEQDSHQAGKSDSSGAMPNNLQNYESRPGGTASQTGPGSTTDSQISQSPEYQSQRVPSSENEDKGAEAKDDASRGTRHSNEHAKRQENPENRSQNTNIIDSKTGGSGISDVIPERTVKNDVLENRPEKTDELHQELEDLTNRTDKEQATYLVQGADVTSDRSKKPETADTQSSASETSEGLPDGQTQDRSEEKSSKSAASESSSNNYTQQQTVIDYHSTRPELLNKQSIESGISKSSSADSLTQDQGNKSLAEQASDEHQSPIFASSTIDHTEEVKAADDHSTDLKTTKERSPNDQTVGNSSDSHSQDQRAPNNGSKEPETSNEELSKSATSEHSSDDHIQEQDAAEDRSDLDKKLSESSTSNNTPDSHSPKGSQSDNSSIGSKASNNQPLRFANSNAETPGPIGAEGIAEKSGTSEKYSPETVPSDKHANVPDTSRKPAYGPGGSPAHPQESSVPSSLSNNHSSAPKTSDDSPQVSAEYQGKPSDADDHPPGQKIDDPSNRFSTPESHFQRQDSPSDPSRRAKDSDKLSKEVASTADDSTKVSKSPSDPTQNTTNDIQQDLEGGFQKADFSERNQHDKVGDTSRSSKDGDLSSYNTGQGQETDREHDRGSQSDEKHRILNSALNNNDRIEKKGGVELMSTNSNEGTTEKSASAVMEAESSESAKTVGDNLEYSGDTSKDKNNNNISV